ncbi:hypothetical protein [Ancylobacter defluvii]|uniref:Uncharacterized protein n=1 Tax=Ancylobacter defluvii TaxID=1282440 RepID=A0A9W6JS33_9HYPH|nr:hypothetical protein [Ancylobacter defluvii]MBS7587561.1 hypothetical protein [Ancylobacter defluvii]GLK82252.1 hypothetical protein GCM10017653_03210 [Ancylobacter defluvii]
MAASFAIAAIHTDPAARQPAADAPSRGVFGRLLDRLIEARTQQARIEIARHAHMAKFDPRHVAALELFARD